MLRILSFFYSRCFSLSCVSILNIFFPLFEATFQIIFTLKTKVCFNQFVCTHQIYKSNRHWFYNKQPLQACFDKICYLARFVHVIWQASCFSNLQQVWKYQVAASLIFTDLMQLDALNRLVLQVAGTDLSRLVIHKLDASCFNNLQQVSKYQVAASLIFATCISIDAFNRLAASCSIRLVKTCYPQACCKLLQQLAAGMQISSCNKADFHRLAATWWSQQTCCNSLTTCSKSVKSTTCSKSMAFLAV